MKEWILLLLAVGIIAIISQILLQNGKTSGILRRCVAIALSVVILSPLPHIFSNHLSLDGYSFDFSYSLDQGFIDYSDSYMINCLTSSLEGKLNETGCKFNEVTIDFIRKDDQIIINTVFVYLPKSVINESDEHINNRAGITRIILENLLIEKEQIVFVGE